MDGASASDEHDDQLPSKSRLLTGKKARAPSVRLTQSHWGCAMEPISITLSAGGKPFMTTRVRSVVFEKADRPGSVDRASEGAELAKPDRSKQADQVTAGRAVEPSNVGQATPPERGAGFGAEARRNAVLANLADPGVTAISSPDKPEQSADGLTDAERDQVEKLKARDGEVKRHEQAHAAVGGQYAGAPTYTYQLGPDGRRYAIGGEVQIDVAPVPGDPEATIDKMTVVKAAALAPAEPSAADRQVASLADAQRLEAVAQLSQKRTEERFAVLEATSQAPAEQQGDIRTTGQPDRIADRLVSATSVLSRSDENLPGQKLDIAA